MKRIIFIAIIIAAFAGQTSSQQLANSLKEEKLTDVAYGPNPRNIMDVYLPADRTTKTPFVLLIHGGGWVGYGKENIREYQDTLLKHGIAVASINHRYANDSTIHYTQMLEDVDAAVNYCMQHAKEWNIRNDNIVMSGVSSGAHLATLYGFTTKRKINAIVEFCGPVNLTDTATLNYLQKVNLLTLVQKMSGANYHQGEPLDTAFANSSPVSYIKPIPVLIVQGDKDPVVPYSQSLQFNQKLQEKGVVHKLVTIPGAGHDLNMKDSATRILVYSEAVNWILKYGK